MHSGNIMQARLVEEVTIYMQFLWGTKGAEGKKTPQSLIRPCTFSLNQEKIAVAPKNATPCYWESIRWSWLLHQCKCELKLCVNICYMGELNSRACPQVFCYWRFNSDAVSTLLPPSKELDTMITPRIYTPCKSK